MYFVMKSLCLFILQILIVTSVSAGDKAFTENTPFGSPYKVVVDGKEANLSFLKGHLELADLMKSNPEAYDLAKKYENYSKLSWGAGMGLSLGALVYLLVTPRESRQNNIPYFMVGGSLIATLVGRPIANSYLRKAVDAYNKKESAIGLSEFEFLVVPLVGKGGGVALGCTF